jgi:hypothetical protein
VQKNPTMGFALILQLTGVNGSRQFDKLTKTKTVESMLTSMDADGIKHYIDYLLNHSNEDGTGVFVIFDNASFRGSSIMSRLGRKSMPSIQNGCG